ncbi:hypothetical protein HK098_002394 [Nowakowskiella sp. JEL0407]|nr:hypothetical protein HK098_002394 [Nowakowskiella sp. JEL0407]
MGNSSTKQTSHLDAFNETELQQLHSTFNSLSSNNPSIQISQIEKQLHPKLYNYFSNTFQSSLNIEQWATAADLFCRKSTYTHQEWISTYFKSDLTGFCEFLAPAVKFSVAAGTVGNKPVSSEFVKFLIGSSIKVDLDDDFEGGIEKSLPSASEGFAKSVYLQRLWNLMFRNMFFGIKDVKYRSETNFPTLISLEVEWLLNTVISDDSKDSAWPCVFSTELHGKSWTVFKSSIMMAKSTLLVIRDHDGHVFGGFASNPWNTAPKYLHSGTKTFPNGLGFGGQLDYFGLFISEDFTVGHSKANPRSSTFGNPRLSNKEEFMIESVEVYSVKAFSDEELEEIMQEKESILASNPEAQAFLEMAGRKLYAKEVGETGESAKPKAAFANIDVRQFMDNDTTPIVPQKG